MKVLIAPDSFKGSLQADEFCHIAEQAILQINPDVQIDKLPLADGGEGSVDALLSLSNSQKICVEDAVDSIGRPVKAYYAYFEYSKTAFIEMASTTGLYQLSDEQRNPYLTNTFGLGLMIKHAAEMGAQKIILGLGGSATNDGGIGCLNALGYEFFDKEGKSIAINNQGLADLSSISRPNLDFLNKIDIYAACDVNNPLTGENGATYIFGPQKGAQQKDLATLDNNLKHYAAIVQQEFNIDIDNAKGAGAAGGMGAGLLLLGAQLKPGFGLIAELLQLEEKVKSQHYDLVITGEGVFNHQSQFGKVPVALSELVKPFNIPVIVICGGIDLDNADIYPHHITAVFSICQRPMSLEYAMENSESLLFQTIQNCFRLFNATPI